MSIAALENFTRDDWHRAADREREALETRLFIDGQFVDAADGGRFETVDPATGETLAEMALAREGDVDRSVAAAGGPGRLDIRRDREAEKVVLHTDFDRLAQVIDRVQHQLQPPAFGADDHVVAQARVVAERLRDDAVHQQHGNDQRYAQGH